MELRHCMVAIENRIVNSADCGSSVPGAPLDRLFV